ncbi:MAG: cytochrome c oxidase assembly protein [Thermomicrobiales bacterium]
MLIGTLLLTVLYLGAATRWRSRFPNSQPIPPGRIAAFLLAMLTLLLALQTPIADLSDHYLFSVHMVEHMLITLVFPPLLLAGVPGWMLRPLFVRFPLLLNIGRGITHPILAYGLFNAVFLGYHLPTIYDLSLSMPLLHVVFHQVFIATSILTWWPILSPLRELPPLTARPVDLSLRANTADWPPGRTVHLCRGPDVSALCRGPARLAFLLAARRPATRRIDHVGDRWDIFPGGLRARLPPLGTRLGGEGPTALSDELSVASSQ